MTKSSPEALYLIALLNEHHGSGWVDASPDGEPGYIRVVKPGGGFVVMQECFSGGETRYIARMVIPDAVWKTLRENPIRRVSP